MEFPSYSQPLRNRMGASDPSVANSDVSSWLNFGSNVIKDVTGIFTPVNAPKDYTPVIIGGVAVVALFVLLSSKR